MISGVYIDFLNVKDVISFLWACFQLVGTTEICQKASRWHFGGKTNFVSYDGYYIFYSNPGITIFETVRIYEEVSAALVKEVICSI